MNSKSKKSFLVVFSVFILIVALAVPVFAFATNGEEELPANEDPNYLYFEPETPGQTCSFALLQEEGAPFVTIQYSLNPDGDWVDYILGTYIDFTSRIYLRGIDNQTFCSGTCNYFKFSEDAKVKAGGSIMSLLNGNGNELTIPSDYCFDNLFYEAKGLVSMPELPATSLKSYCYSYMFYQCINLKEVSSLPAKDNLPSGCYHGMFCECSSLEATPEFTIDTLDPLENSQCYAMFYSCSVLHSINCHLNATVLTSFCYTEMFFECTSLKMAPELPATELANSCYYSMFESTALVESPYLPAEILTYDCYYDMFSKCSDLSKVTVGFHEWYDGPTNSWLYNVSSSGTLYGPDDLTEPPSRSSSTIPESWSLAHNPHIQADVQGFSGIYDALPHSISVHSTSPYNPTVHYSNDGVSYSTQEISYTDIGFHVIFYRLTADGFQELKGSAVIEIKQRDAGDVTFKESTYSKDYGDEDPDFDVTFDTSKLVEGDTPVKDVDYVITRQRGENASASGYEVTFRWLRDKNYTFPETKTKLTINKATNFKLVADPASKSGSEADPAFTAHAEGLKFKDELKSTDYEVTVSETNNPTTKILTPSLTDAGKSKFSANYDLNGTYVTTADFDIYFESGLKYKVNSFNGVYDANDHVFRIDIDPALGANVQYSIDEPHEIWQDNPPSFKKAGTYQVAYKITCTGYEEVLDESSLFISKKEMSIKASYKEIYYGEAKPNFDAEVAGMVEGEDLPETDYTVSSVATDVPDPGSYDIVVELATDRSPVLDNYNPSLINSKLFVKNYNKISYTSSGLSVVYDGNPHSINVLVETPSTYKIEYKLAEGEYSETNPSFKDATVSPQIVFYKITPTDPSYETIEGQEVVNIEKRSATIIANAAYKNKGEAEPELTAQIKGLVAGESLQPQEDYILSRDEGEEPGVYEIHCSLLSNAVADNYNLETVDSKFFVLGQETPTPPPTPTPEPPSPEQINADNVAQTGDNNIIPIAALIVVLASAGWVCCLAMKLRRKQ